MKKNNILFVICLSLIFTSGCDNIFSPNIVVEGTGDVISKPIVVPSFNSFKLDGWAEVHITTADTQSVVLKAQQEILDVMTYVVSSEELTVSFKKNMSVKTQKGIEIEIIIPEIEKITLNGAGNFELSGDKQDGLDIVVSGSGDIRAYGLEVDNGNISISGTCNCQVRVNTSLSVSVSGVGYVYYKGSPTIHSNISGVGSIIDDN